MNEIVYDIAIREVAKILDKSDRQVRRYVKAKGLEARPVRINGHMKLMFNRDEVEAFKGRFTGEGVFAESGRRVVADTQLLEEGRVVAEGAGDDVDTTTRDVGESATIKYVIDALGEHVKHLQAENKELHYQLEQRSGQVGFLQGKVETLEEEMKMLMPAPESREEIVKRKPWYRRMFGA